MNLNDDLNKTAANGGIAGGKQEIVTVGLNWYVTRNLRFMLDYMHGKIDKHSAAGPVFTDAGSKFDAVAMRSQFAF